MTRHATCEEEVNLLSKFQLPSSHGLGVNVFWRYFNKGWLSLVIIQFITKVFVDQRRLHQVCKFLTMKPILQFKKKNTLSLIKRITSYLEKIQSYLKGKILLYLLYIQLSVYFCKSLETSQEVFIKLLESPQKVLWKMWESPADLNIHNIGVQKNDKTTQLNLLYKKEKIVEKRH